MDKKKMKFSKQLMITIIVGLFAIIGEVLIAWLWTEERLIKEIILTVLTTVFSVASVEVIWELISKKHYSEFIIEEFRKSTNIEASGICEHFEDYTNIVWSEELNKKKKLFVFFAHGHGWLKAVKDPILEDFLKHGKMSVCFAKPFNSGLMKTYDTRFGYDDGQTKKKVKESLQIIEEFNKNLSKRKAIEVYFTDQESTTSYYFVGKNNEFDYCIATLYNHSTNSARAPALKVIKYNSDTNKKSKLFSFFEKDLGFIQEKAKRIDNVNDVLLHYDKGLDLE